MKLLRNTWFYFVIIILTVLIANKSYETFFFRPCSAHLWRQCDGASYALNYYQNDISFLPPQVHQRHAEDGRAVSEFPIVYFIAGKLYSVFGFHDYFIRLLHVGIFLLGLIYITKTAKLFSKNTLLQLVPAAFTLTSPLLFYYGANFLPDVAALSLAMIGFYYFVLFDQLKSIPQLFLALLFFTLAGLLKISGAILLLSAISFLVFQLLFNKIYFKGIPTLKAILIFLLSLLSIVILYGWVAYDKYVAEHYHFGGNLFGFLPIWEASKEEIRSILDTLRHQWMRVFMAKYVWGLLVVSIGLLIVFFKKSNALLRFTSIICFIGVILYMACWFKTFNVHDYYLVNLFCFPILLFYVAIDMIEKKEWLLKKQFAIFTSIALSLIFIYAVIHSRHEQIERYYGKHYNTFNTAYYRIEPYLRKIGIGRNDVIVSVPDVSPNVTLYLMNTIGFTECYTGEEYNINYFAYNKNAKYLVVSDTTYLNKAPYASYCQSQFKIGEFEGIQIFKIVLP